MIFDKFSALRIDPLPAEPRTKNFGVRYLAEFVPIADFHQAEIDVRLNLTPRAGADSNLRSLIRRTETPMPKSPTIEITYCRLCGWGLRAAWMAQELLTTFAEELGSVTLTPDVTGGVFEIRADGGVIWSRKEMGRFPEITEVKRIVRDHVAPGRSLGHTDRV
jgi:selenoprotein W-related protein